MGDVESGNFTVITSTMLSTGLSQSLPNMAMCGEEVDHFDLIGASNAKDLQRPSARFFAFCAGILSESAGFLPNSTNMGKVWLRMTLYPLSGGPH